MTTSPSTSDSPPAVRQIADGVFRADVQYTGPEMTAAYLVADSNQGAIIDCGVPAGVDAVRRMTAAAGLQPDDIATVIPTHAHLDHSAAAGLLADIFPRAIFAAHPSAAKHIANPHAKLVPAARALYGEAFFEKHYGKVPPVPADRVRELADGETVAVGARKLSAPHTPGHAWHHLSIWDETSGTMFAGDSMGVSYREFDSENGEPFVAPSTPPTQFDPDAMRESVRKMQSFHPARIAFAHFDVAPFSAEVADRTLDMMERWMEKARGLTPELTGDDDAAAARLTMMLRADLAETTGADSGKIAARFRTDLLLCSTGLLHWLRKGAK